MQPPPTRLVVPAPPTPSLQNASIPVVHSFEPHPYPAPPSMASTDYQYESLSSESSFRVLRLLPAQPGLDKASIVEIELFEANLDSPPNFEAISYAWGQEDAHATVVCNGRRLFVTRNVVLVLQALRRSGSSQVLWIDQIAIDQSSIPERNIQVPRMRSIYRQATKVWIWLGEGSYEIDVAFEYILDVNKICSDENLDMKDLTDKARRELAKSPKETADTHRLLHRIDTATFAPREAFHAKVRQARGYHDPVDTSFIMDLLNLPWFCRTWTVQELVLAREATLLLGTKSISWHSFSLILDVLQLWENQGEQLQDQLSVANPASYTEALACCDTLKDLVQIHGHFRETPVYKSLKCVRAQRSSDPKDKVYGLYGIFDQMRISRLPRVDYSKSVQEVYTEITRVAIEVEGSLDILQELCVPSRISNLPSWAPDWSNTDYVSPMGSNLPERLPGQRKVPHDFPSPVNLEAKVEFHGSELILSGTLIDELVDIAPSSSVSTPGFRRGYNARQQDLGGAPKRQLATTELVLTLQTWLRYSRHLKTYPIPRSGVPKPPQEAFWETIRFGARWVRYFDFDAQPYEDFVMILTANEAGSKVDLATLHEEVRVKPEYQAIKNDFVHIFGCSNQVEDWSEEMKIRLFLKVYSPEVADIQHDVSLHTYNRTLFTTRDGHLGMGPRWVERGDCVALIAGLEWPFVVRREGSKYRLVGPAKVHGDMLGERWDENKLERMTFV